MVPHLLLYLWLVMLYTVTAATARLDVLLLPPELLEARNIVVHSASYAVLGVLLGWSTGEPRRGAPPRTWAVLLLCVAALGVGQEALQTVLRQQAYPVNSVFDVAVDVAGATGGLLLYRRFAAPTARRDAPRSAPLDSEKGLDERMIS